ncbi:glycosyltransferase [Staphylococcus coagulans]|uniref:glycosyltransferase n=2 Tax=Staphylococcus coagulans TaxID=74706 RepID=UPI001BEBF4E1|nr:glycosyltransferase [Staphylococcus coagulans]MBT2814369.1 glycosyltransferase [Staphylococcus coagulans]MBT2816714.1 glycosyltransferase [Staphylococcus coagulans]MBT2837352.1 glycosyltransferase [Staphylococcus coagulans]MBT2841855.1 glycosyltransferase [Staphylococcus coagulans]MBT2848620.1 glycosyltransferase [Staphylococcus coagulans]
MIYTITSTLPEYHGGRTKSLLRRVQFMEEHIKKKQVILTTNYNPNYPLVLERFRRRGILSSETKVLNIYEWLTDGLGFYFPQSNFRKKPKYRQCEIEIPGLTSEKSNKNDRVRRYYDGKNYVLYREYHDIESEILKMEDFMLPSQKHKVERREYNEYGYLHRIINYDTKLNIKLSDRLYNSKGEVYCVRHFNQDKSNKLSHIAIYKKGKIFKAFSNEKQLFTYFYENVISEGAIVFNDARLLDRSILDVRKPIKKVFMIHSSHKNLNGDMKNSYSLIQKRSNEIDKVIVLTDHQKSEMVMEFNLEEHRISVIPHFAEIKNVKNDKRRPSFLFIGRIDENKQVNHILEAFKIYRDAGFNYDLNIYGYGESKDIKNMQAEIKNLGLSEHVKYHGKTDEPEVLFAQHAASILTSQYEGFALSVMESLNNGCPVISYDIRYGPRELIEVSKNGFLVDSQNINDLAEKMKEITRFPIGNVQLNDRFSNINAAKNYKLLIENLKN